MLEYENLLSSLNELCSGMFSDALDELGYRDQVADLPIANHNSRRFLGSARTVELEDADDADEKIDLGLGFLAQCNRGEVLVVKGSRKFAYFGELMTAISIRVGISGVVIDGLTRDKNATWQSELPVASAGYSPKDIKGRGRVARVDVPIQIAGVSVRPGDLVFGDSDGVVITPSEIIPKICKKIVAAVNDERQINEKIREGMTVDQILKRHRSF